MNTDAPSMFRLNPADEGFNIPRWLPELLEEFSSQSEVLQFKEVWGSPVAIWQKVTRHVYDWFLL